LRGTAVNPAAVADPPRPLRAKKGPAAARRALLFRSSRGICSAIALLRHCEERSGEAIQLSTSEPLDCLAALATTDSIEKATKF
jgi:hypothetical protein